MLQMWQVDTETNCCGLCFAVETAGMPWVAEGPVMPRVHWFGFQQQIMILVIWLGWQILGEKFANCKDLFFYLQSKLLEESCLNPTNVKLFVCATFGQCVVQCQFSWPQIYYSHYSRYLETKVVGIFDNCSATHCLGSTILERHPLMSLTWRVSHSISVAA